MRERPDGDVWILSKSSPDDAQVGTRARSEDENAHGAPDDLHTEDAPVVGGRQFAGKGRDAHSVTARSLTFRYVRKPGGDLRRSRRKHDLSPVEYPGPVMKSHFSLLAPISGTLDDDIDGGRGTGVHHLVCGNPRDQDVLLLCRVTDADGEHGDPKSGGPVNGVFSFGVHPVRQHDDRPDVGPFAHMCEREQRTGDIRGLVTEGVGGLPQRAAQRRAEGIELCLDAGRDGAGDDGREKGLNLFSPVARPVHDRHARTPVRKDCHDRRMMDDERSTQDRLQQQDEQERKGCAAKQAQGNPPGARDGGECKTVKEIRRSRGGQYEERRVERWRRE